MNILKKSLLTIVGLALLMSPTFAGDRNVARLMNDKETKKKDRSIAGGHKLPKLPKGYSWARNGYVTSGRIYVRLPGKKAPRSKKRGPDGKFWWRRLPTDAFHVNPKRIVPLPSKKITLVYANYGDHRGIHWTKPKVEIDGKKITITMVEYQDNMTRTTEEKNWLAMKTIPVQLPTSGAYKIYLHKRFMGMISRAGFSRDKKKAEPPSYLPKLPKPHKWKARGFLSSGKVYLSVGKQKLTLSKLAKNFPKLQKQLRLTKKGKTVMAGAKLFFTVYQYGDFKGRYCGPMKITVQDNKILLQVPVFYNDMNYTQEYSPSPFYETGTNQDRHRGNLPGVPRQDPGGNGESGEVE